MKELKERWRLFGDVVLDPWTLILIVGLIFLFALSSNPNNSSATSLFFVLITLTSAVLGGRITKHWVDLTEGGVVIARGKSAVRSLKLLLRNIASLESRIHIFRVNEEEIEKHPEVTKRNYEEIISTCNLLQEETVNSIENWTDIIPEADITTQIGVITDLKVSLSEKEEDLNKLNGILEQNEGKSDNDKISLEEKIHEKETQIRQIERQINARQMGLASLGLISENTATASLFNTPLENRNRLLDLAHGKYTDVSGGSREQVVNALLARKTQKKEKE